MTLHHQNEMAAIILAAGKGSRMKSDLPKVLHLLHDKTILEHVVAAVQGAGISQICLVLSKDLAPFQSVLKKHPDLNVCIQNGQKGTGDAVAATTHYFSHSSAPYFSDGTLERGQPSDATYVLICLGDVPALSSGALQKFIATCKKHEADLGVLGFEPPDPTGYGRLVKEGAHQLHQIVEEKDADSATKSIRACNTGIIFAKVEVLFTLLDKIKPQNQQGEFYLTDCVKLACQLNYRTCVEIGQPWQSFAGVNTPDQLAMLSDWMRNQS